MSKIKGNLPLLVERLWMEGICVLSINKEKFFTERQLPKIKYRYLYNGENYEMSSDYIINSMGNSEEKCLFLLDELNATDDFLTNIYLQDLADECMQGYLKNKLYKEIRSSLLDEHKSYKFKLDTVEYIAYQDDKRRYHIDEVDEVGEYAGSARFIRFTDYLFAILNSHIFDCKRINQPIVD